jgi:NAD(P)-dependent dehydrogenase (short-subunit alcohol dehydrogenase family)
MRRALQSKVVLVAGTTRGAGRGIAVELGAAGATVYVTGRSTRLQRSEYNRPETLEETAALVSHAGGQGRAVQVDHLDPAQVQALVTRIEGEQGRHAIATEPHCVIVDTPRYIGRAVAALAEHPEMARRSGQSLLSGQLAKVYGVTDLDGSQPDAWRYVREVQDAGNQPMRLGTGNAACPTRVCSRPLPVYAPASLIRSATAERQRRASEVFDAIAP